LTATHVGHRLPGQHIVLPLDVAARRRRATAPTNKVIDWVAFDPYLKTIQATRQPKHATTTTAPICVIGSLWRFAKIFAGLQRF
jgi:hypothetical protein